MGPPVLCGGVIRDSVTRYIAKGKNLIGQENTKKNQILVRFLQKKQNFLGVAP
jgi:hypothetical protein